MSFFDFLKVNKYKSEIASLQSDLSVLTEKYFEMESAFDSIKGKDYYEIVKETDIKKHELAELIDSKTIEYENLIQLKSNELSQLNSSFESKLAELKSQIDLLEKSLEIKKE